MAKYDININTKSADDASANKSGPDRSFHIVIFNCLFLSFSHSVISFKPQSITNPNHSKYNSFASSISSSVISGHSNDNVTVYLHLRVPIFIFFC
eukprot:139636_1